MRRSQYDFFIGVVPDFRDLYTFYEFMETSRIIHSRVFNHIYEKDKVTIIPFGDLINHRNPPDLIWKYGTNA